MTILLAWLLDWLFGEPPASLHPVAWMGRYLRAARTRSRPTLWCGALAWLGGAIAVVGLAGLAQWIIIRYLPGWADLTLTALLLKPLFAWRALREAAQSVLDAPDLASARKLLAWHLVSRETSDLSAGEVRGATIESLAENLSDSLVAPLLYFVIGGLPLAALYRYANTADAMWGYRTPDLERFGKVAARADDLFNLVPSRLTALLLCLACWPAGLKMGLAWRIWWRDACLTPSPNAGQPMSTASGALGVQLNKRGLYTLGAEFPEPTPADVRRAICLTTLAAWLVVVLMAVVSAALQSLISWR